jgi:hypothetical protein
MLAVIFNQMRRELRRKIENLKNFLFVLPQKLIAEVEVKKGKVFDTNAQVRPNYGGGVIRRSLLVTRR